MASKFGLVQMKKEKLFIKFKSAENRLSKFLNPSLDRVKMYYTRFSTILLNV